MLRLATLARRLLPPTAAALVLSCEGSPSGDENRCRSASACGATDALVVMSDQSSGGVSAISAAAGSATTGFFGVDLGADPQLSVSRGRSFYVARDLDAIFELSPRCGEPLCRFSTKQDGLSGSSNPQGVGAAPDGSLWVPRFASATLALLEGGGVRQTLPLPDLDGDGNPNASGIAIVDVDGVSKAIVTLGLLDDKNATPFRAVRPGALAIFDVATRTLERTTPLAGRNPFNAVVFHGGALFVTDAGNFDADDERDAGIERVDPHHPEDARLLITEATLGGSASAVAIADGCGAAIIADRSKTNATSVVTFDPETGAPLRTATQGGVLFGPSLDYHFWAIAFVGDKLLVGDRRRSASGYPIHVWNKTGRCELVPRESPIYVAQKPVALRAMP